MIGKTDFKAWIIVRHNETPFISAPIDAEMNPRFDMVSWSAYARLTLVQSRIHVYLSRDRRTSRHDMVSQVRTNPFC